MYVKLFGSILDSSVWSCDSDTRIVWVTLLAMADHEGMIRASLSGIARRAVVSEPAAEKALAIFTAPDPDSKNQDHDGRRIERVNGGWFLHNYKEYREIRTTDQLANAERQRRFRGKSKGVTDNVTPVTGSVTDSHVDVDVDVDVDAEVDVKGKKEQSLVGQSDGLSVALTLTSENPVVPVNGNGHRPKTHVEIREHLAMVLGEVQQGRKDRIRVEEMRTIKAELVFAYWQAELGHEKAKLDPTRLNRLKKCLKGNGDNVHELLYAVDGWSKDPTFRQLAEKEGRKLDGIENIFESQSRIERLAGHCKGYRDSTPHRMAVKYLEAVQS